MIEGKVVKGWVYESEGGAPFVLVGRWDKENGYRPLSKFSDGKRDKNGHLEDFSCCTHFNNRPNLHGESIPTKKDKNAPVSVDWL